MKRILFAAVALAAGLFSALPAQAQQYVRVYSPETAVLMSSSSGVATSYYAPTTAYYAPTTAYYAPTTAYYAPTTAYYVAGSGARDELLRTGRRALHVVLCAGGGALYELLRAGRDVLQRGPYIPGQPVRNFFRGY